MSLLVDTKSGAGFGTGLDVYLRTTSRHGRDGLMSSLSGAEPGMPEATPHHSSSEDSPEGVMEEVIGA